MSVLTVFPSCSAIFCGLKLRNEHPEIKEIFAPNLIFLISLRSKPGNYKVKTSLETQF